VLETLPQLFGYDIEVFRYFQTQLVFLLTSDHTCLESSTRNHLCGYDLNLTYPQNGKFPTLLFRGGTGTSATLANSLRGSFTSLLLSKYQSMKKRGLLKRGRDREEARNNWKRDLSQRPNGTIDPYYGCSLLGEAIDYALNFTFPWNYSQYFDVSSNISDARHSTHTFLYQVYNAPSALNPQSFFDASAFLNGWYLSASCRTLMTTMNQIMPPDEPFMHRIRPGHLVRSMTLEVCRSFLKFWNNV
jgi:carboxypeptidase D